MKKSSKQTEYLLIRAYTGSDWDGCEFAVIHCTDEWKRQFEKRVAAVQPFKNDYNFQSMNYYDTAVDFYRTDKDDQPDIEDLLGDKNCVFVETDKAELASLSVPENRLDRYRLVIFRSGIAYYQAFGKHSGEEFWTDEFSLTLLNE